MLLLSHLSALASHAKREYTFYFRNLTTMMIFSIINTLNETQHSPEASSFKCKHSPNEEIIMHKWSSSVLVAVCELMWVMRFYCASVDPARSARCTTNKQQRALTELAIWAIWWYEFQVHRHSSSYHRRLDEGNKKEKEEKSVGAAIALMKLSSSCLMYHRHFP